jgi:hypothetical protein
MKYSMKMFLAAAAGTALMACGTSATATPTTVDTVTEDALVHMVEEAFGTLFDQLVAEGSASDAAAMRVGVTIEQMDIADLQGRLAATMPSDVAQAFERLLAGSERHLAAFQR